MTSKLLKLLRLVWPLWVLLGAWALFFWRFAAPALPDRLTYPPGDFSAQFGVFRDLAYRAWVAGRFPLWVDCTWSGYPFHADPQAQIFYPPLWLIFGALRLQGWGNFPLNALVAEVVLHYLLTSIFVYLFLRSVALRRPAAVLGALVFTYSGYLTGSPPLQTATLEVVTWLPLALLFAGRLAQRRSLRDLALTALMLTLAFLAGHPQTFVYVALLTLAYFAFCARQARWRFGAFCGGAAALIGLTSALSAVQLLPTLHFILNSTRGTAVAFERAGGGFPIGDLVQFFVTGWVSWWHPLYVGVLPLGLAAFAFRDVRPAVRFWGGAALAGLLLSFGTRAVAFDVAYWLVPGFSFFQGPEHLAVVVSFSLAVLAAYGAHSLMAPLTRAGRQALSRLARAGQILLMVSLLVLALAVFLSAQGIDPSAWHKFPDRAGVLMLAAGLGWLALMLRARAPALRRWIPAVFIGVVVLDLFAANRPVNVVPVFDPFPPNAFIAPILDDTGFFRVQDDFQLPGHAGCAYGFRATGGIAPYQIATYRRFMDQTPENVRWPLLGVKYVVSWRAELYDAAGQRVPADVLAEGTERDAKGNVTKTHRLELEPRRAFFVHQTEVIQNDDALYTRLAAPDFDPRQTVIVSQAVEVKPGGDDSLTVVRDIPGEIDLQATVAHSAVLVVSEAYFPGWRVTVDGIEADLLRADGALLAVAMPPGQHVVKFAYLPATLIWGGMISGVALVIVCGLVVLKRGRHAN